MTHGAVRARHLGFGADSQVPATDYRKEHNDTATANSRTKTRVGGCHLDGGLAVDGSTGRPGATSARHPGEYSSLAWEDGWSAAAFATRMLHRRLPEARVGEGGLRGRAVSADVAQRRRTDPARHWRPG